jgi:hypothetical protein
MKGAGGSTTSVHAAAILRPSRLKAEGAGSNIGNGKDQALATDFEPLTG